ncbi:MAG: 50S ribosomal protein L13 [Firmicutes bacterium]|jgi:large subunit ribosomal protein L13|nr:50S ribosomal protein L13 [Bacillota bacterium]
MAGAGLRPKGIEGDWYIVDAEGKTLGRLASQIASVLRGKHKPSFSPHLDMGDYVIVVNAEKIRVTGDKLRQKMYYRHSGYPGGLRAVSLGDMLRKRPEAVIENAVTGMLPHNRLGRKIRRKLKVYSGPDHPHAAQSPKPLEIEG